MESVCMKDKTRGEADADADVMMRIIYLHCYNNYRAIELYNYITI